MQQHGNQHSPGALQRCHKLKTDNHSHSIDTVAFCSLSINPVSENQVAIFNPILSLAATLASPIMNDMSQLP